MKEGAPDLNLQVQPEIPEDKDFAVSPAELPKELIEEDLSGLNHEQLEARKQELGKLFLPGISDEQSELLSQRLEAVDNAISTLGEVSAAEESPVETEVKKPSKRRNSKDGMAEEIRVSIEDYPVESIPEDDLINHGNYLVSQMDWARKNGQKELVEELNTRFQQVKDRANREAPAIEQATIPPEAISEPVIPTPEEAASVEEVKEVLEVKEEIEAMPEEDKEKLSIGLANIGYLVEEKKNKFFAEAFDFASTKSRLKEGSLAARYTAELRDSFVRDAESARKNAEDPKAGAMKYATSAGLLFGNALKYGRSISDATGLSLVSPLRYAMMAGMAFTRGSEAAKEVRLKNEAVVEKTTIYDADKAAEEAWKIYEKAQNKAGKDGEVSAESLKLSYLNEMPKDLMERITRDPGTANNFVQKILRADLKGSIDRLNDSLKKVERDASLSAGEKLDAKEALIRKQERNLRDYDRIITQYGTVDTLAMAGRYAETAGKAVVGAVTVETLVLSADRLWDMLSRSLSGTDAHDVVASATTESARKPEFAPKDALAQPEPDITKADKGPFWKRWLGMMPKPTEAVAENPAPEESLNGLEGGNIEASLEPEADLPKPSMMNMGAPDIAKPEVYPLELDADGKGIETIHKGESVSKAIHDMVNKGEISKEEFLKAWKNPESLVDVKGEKVHISKIGLVYEGNQVKFIPGENGAPGRFEVLQGVGKEYGTDKELYARYQEIGKKAPAWLEKSVLGHPIIDEPLPKPSMMSVGMAETSLDTADIAGINKPAPVEEVRSMLGTIFPEAYGGEPLEIHGSTLDTQLVVLERWDESFNEKSLAWQKSTVEGMAPLKEHLEDMLQEPVHANPHLDEVYRDYIKDMLEEIEHMEGSLKNTEQALRDKITMLGIRSWEYDTGVNKIPVDKLMEEGKGDTKTAKLAEWVASLKPVGKELKLDTDTFIRSRFR